MEAHFPGRAVSGRHNNYSDSDKGTIQGNRAIRDRRGERMEEIEFSIYKDFEKQYLMITGEEELSALPDMKMLLYNKIPGFLPVDISLVDGAGRYYYEIQGMVSLAKLIEEERFAPSSLCTFYEQLTEAIRRGREYFLQEVHYILRADKLFWNIQKQQIGICYYPGWKKDMRVQMISLNQFLMERMPHSDRSCIHMIYEIDAMLQQEEFSLEVMEEYCRQFSRNIKESEFESAGTGKIRSGERKGDGRQSGIKKRKEHKENSGYRIAPGSGKGLVWRLRLVKGYRGLPEEILVGSREVTVGRMEQNDVVLPAKYISRYHARLAVEKGMVAVYDCGSTNGTNRNNKKISAKEWLPCRKGDIISFADISYQITGLL